VAVAFEIEAPTFRNNLPQRAQAEDELARVIADEFAQRWRFADWLPRAQAGAAPIGSVTARLVELPAQPGPQIAVRWFGSFGGAGTVPLNGLLPIEVYAPSNPNWHSNNRAEFVSHVKGKLLATIRPDGFIDERLRREVVQRLPIASSIEVVPGDRVIVIPRLWKHLQLGPKSVLVVRFARGSGVQEEQGQLLLALPSQRPRDPLAGFVQAGVREATFGPRTLPLTGGWNATLPSLLTGTARLAAFIDAYDPLLFDGASGGVVLNPD
jgi:hypothetical protein